MGPRTASSVAPCASGIFFLFCCVLLSAAWRGPDARANIIEDYEKALDSRGDRTGGGGLLPPSWKGAKGESSPVRKRLEAADRHFRAGSFELALRETEQARQLAPQSLSIAIAHAELCNRTGRHELAIETARGVLESAPESAQAHDIIGTALVRMNKPELAAKEYREVVRLAPNRAIGYRHLGDAYWALGNLTDALAQYEASLKRDPGSVSANVRIAAILQEMGDNRGAIERASRTLEIAPKNALARAIRGNAYFALGRYREAGEQLEAAVRLQPTFIYFRERLGVVEVAQGNLTGAVRTFRRVLDLDPANLTAHEHLVQLYSAGKQPALAEYHAGFLALAQRSTGKAMEHYRAALKHDPRLKAAWLDLAAIHLKQENAGAAIAAAEKALEIDRASATALSIMGQAWRLRGNKAEAERRYRQAIEAEPSYWPAHLHLADHLRAEGRCPDAVAHYARVIRSTPATGDTYRKLGDCLKAAGRTDEAMEAYRRSGKK